MINENGFLQPGISQIRKSIRDIDDSYNNDWDILAELTQNAIDAINKRNPDTPELKITVNSMNNFISIEDNGTGINPDELNSLLAPFSTNKDQDTETIGEKGVGLTFVLFSCNHFKIISKSDEGEKAVEIIDAENWKNSSKVELIKEKEIDDEFNSFDRGTMVSLQSLNKTLPLFTYSNEQLIYVLRTRTAVGNVNRLWDENLGKIKITLDHTDINGNQFISEIENKYWMVYEDLDKNSIISLDEFIKYAEEASRTDQEKRVKLRDKIITKDGVWKHKNREIKYKSCFVPNRDVWQERSKHFGICKEEDIESELWQEELGYLSFGSGLFTSVKGMPTGISIEHPQTGFSGYWSNIFILIEDKHLKFDIGRKSIHGMTGRIYKKYAKELFNKHFLKYITKYVSGQIIEDSEWDRDEVFDEIDNLLDLSLENTKFLKSPKDQEASVAAIFFECIGNGLIENIDPIISGYRSKYDLYARWGKKKLVVEFKAKLQNILKDFTDHQKLFDEVNLVVCWGVTENDEEAMHKKGISVEVVKKSQLGSPSKKEPPHSTHYLNISGFNNPIYVIDLKQIVTKS